MNSVDVTSDFAELALVVQHFKDDPERHVNFADRGNAWGLLLRDRPSKTGTVADLFAIPLAPSRRIVRLIPEINGSERSRVRAHLDSLDGKLSDAFLHYKALAASSNTWSITFADVRHVTRWWLRTSYRRYKQCLLNVWA